MLASTEIFPHQYKIIKNSLNNRPIIRKFQQSFCIFPVAQKSDQASEKASESERDFLPSERKNKLEWLPGLALSRVVSDIFNVEKCRDLQIGVKGHSRSSNVLSFDRLCMVSYQCSLVTLSLKRTVLRYSTCKYTVTLKPGLGVTRGHRHLYL